MTLPHHRCLHCRQCVADPRVINDIIRTKSAVLRKEVHSKQLEETASGDLRLTRRVQVRLPSKHKKKILPSGVQWIRHHGFHDDKRQCQPPNSRQQLCPASWLVGRVENHFPQRNPLTRTHLTPCEHVLCAQMPTLSQWDPAYFWLATSWAAAVKRHPATSSSMDWNCTGTKEGKGI